MGFETCHYGEGGGCGHRAMRWHGRSFSFYPKHKIPLGVILAGSRRLPSMRLGLSLSGEIWIVEWIACFETLSGSSKGGEEGGAGNSISFIAL